MKQPHHARRRVFVQRRVQGRVILAFFSAASVVTVFQVILLGYVLTRLAEGLPSDGGLIVRRLPTLLGAQALLSLLVLAPALTLVGGLETLRILGPIYRFERYLESIVRGEKPGPCVIRENDELKGLCDLLNRATQPLLERSDGVVFDTGAECAPSTPDVDAVPAALPVVESAEISDAGDDS